MRDRETVRDVAVFVGGFLGMFLGGLLGFAVFTKIAFDNLRRGDDARADLGLGLWPFVGVVLGGLIGAAAGAILSGVLVAAFMSVFGGSPARSGRGPKNDGGPSI